MVSENKSQIPEKDQDLYVKEPTVFKAYTVRWYILIVYVLYTTIATLQMVEYSIITSIITKYYNVSASTVDWSSLVFTIVWPFGVFPASFLIDKKGLRFAALIGSILTAIGTAVKLFSFEQDRFYVVIIGQFLVAVAKLFLQSLAPKIAVTWFKPKEVSTICALGVLGIHLGAALGNWIPTVAVKNSDNMDEIRSDLEILSYALTATIVPVALAVLIYFPEKPPHPPSETLAKELENKEQITVARFLQLVKTLVKNVPFMVHLVGYGISVGTTLVFGTLLNSIVLDYFEDAEEDTGRMGLAMLVLGMVGSVVTGFVLDKTHRFKGTAFMIFLLTTISFGGVTLALQFKIKWLVYLTIAIFGFFINGYMPAGIQFAIELTYPADESTTTNILMASSRILGFLFTLAFRQIISNFGTLWSLVGIIGLLLVGTLLTGLTPNILKRQEVFRLELEIDKKSGEKENIKV